MIVLYLQLLTQKIYHFQYLSLGFILKIFLKFGKFQSQYSYKCFSYIHKKECMELDYSEESVPLATEPSKPGYSAKTPGRGCSNAG